MRWSKQSMRLPPTDRFKFRWLTHDKLQFSSPTNACDKVNSNIWNLVMFLYYPVRFMLCVSGNYVCDLVLALNRYNNILPAILNDIFISINWNFKKKWCLNWVGIVLHIGVQGTGKMLWYPYWLYQEIAFLTGYRNHIGLVNSDMCIVCYILINASRLMNSIFQQLCVQMNYITLNTTE